MFRVLSRRSVDRVEMASRMNKAVGGFLKGGESG